MSGELREGRRTLVQVTIVSYRTAALVNKSLAALATERATQSARGIDITCFVIDNSGIDHELVAAEVAARGWTDWVTVVRAERNGGFAYGNNRGFEHGFSQEVVPDYFYLLNPDAEVRPGAIAELVDFMNREPRAGAAASGIEDHDGQLWPHAFRFPNIGDEIARGVRLGLVARLLQPFLTARRMSGETEQVDWFPGAGMMCRTEVLRQLGGMDEAYFLYFEETDFCLKLVRHGWTNWYVPKSRITHETGQSTGVTAAGNEAARLPRYWFESRRRYFIKNHGLAYAILTDLAGLVAHTLGELQLVLRGRTHEIRRRFIRDFLENGCLRPAGWSLPPAQDVLSPSLPSVGAGGTGERSVPLVG